jgi:hypothetical protein
MATRNEPFLSKPHLASTIRNISMVDFMFFKKTQNKSKFKNFVPNFFEKRYPLVILSNICEHQICAAYLILASKTEKNNCYDPALRTRSNTPNYGFLFQVLAPITEVQWSLFKINRYQVLATKVFGEKLKQQVEDRLVFSKG